MKKCLIVVAGLLMSACSGLPERDGDIGDLSFTDFAGQPAAVFENSGAQTIVFGDIQTGEVRVYSQGQWNPRAPDFEHPIQPDSTFDGKLIVPMVNSGGFIFERPTTPSSPEPDPILILGLDRNPCIPNAGCGGDFGRALMNIREVGTVFSCPDSDVNGFYSSREACEARCSTACEQKLGIIGP